MSVVLTTTMDHIVADQGYWDDGRPKKMELLHYGDDVPADIPPERVKELENVGAIGDAPPATAAAAEPQLPGPPSEEEAEAARKTPAVQEEIRLSRSRVENAAAAAGRPVKEGAWKDVEKGSRSHPGAEAQPQAQHHNR